MAATFTFWTTHLQSCGSRTWWRNSRSWCLLTSGYSWYHAFPALMQPPKPATPEPTSLSLEIWMDSELERVSYYDVEVKLQTVFMTLHGGSWALHSLKRSCAANQVGQHASSRKAQGSGERGESLQFHDDKSMTPEGEISKRHARAAVEKEQWHCFSTLWRHACSITLWDLLLLMPMNQNVRNLLDFRWVLLNSWEKKRKMKSTGATSGSWMESNPLKIRKRQIGSPHSPIMHAWLSRESVTSETKSGQVWNNKDYTPLFRITVG